MKDTRRLRRPLSAAVCASLLLSSCGVAASAQPVEVDDDDGVEPPAIVEGAGDYGVVAAPPLPIVAPAVSFDPSSSIANVDGSVLVDLAAGELVFRQGTTGEVVAKATVGEASELRAVAGNGTKAALFESVAGADGSKVSRITVVERGGSGESPTSQVFDLPGLIEPEAFSTDGEMLFVIDHQVGGQPGSYRVRPFDLATGELQTIVGPTKVPFTDDMNGVGRRQIWSPNGTRLYTLYIRQTHHHHDDGSAHGHGEPGTDGFVHVLDLEEEWAFCLDLPAAFGAGDLATTALAVSPSDNTIAVADLHAGAVAFASTIDLAVTRVVDLPPIEPVGDLYLALTSKEIVLGWGTEVHWYDSATLTPLGHDSGLPADLMGFTSNGNTVVAWSNSGPTELRRP